jgi:hypothetical protein
MRPRPRWPLIRAGLITVGLLAIGLVAHRTVRDASSRTWPSWPYVLGAAAMTIVATVAGAHAWAWLLNRPLQDRASTTGSYYSSQLTKYLPAGGVVQAASQAAFAADGTTPLASAVVALPVYALATVAAAATVGAGIALDANVAGWWRIVAALGVLSPAVLYRPLLRRALTLLRRVSRRMPEAEHLPAQSSIVRCYAASIVNIGAFGLAYALLVQPSVVSVLTLTSAAAVAWAIGFIVVPLPAGIGAREAVLVSVVPGAAAAALLTASLIQRLLAIGTEVGLAAFSGASRVRRRRSARLEAVNQSLGPRSRSRSSHDASPDWPSADRDGETRLHRHRP